MWWNKGPITFFFRCGDATADYCRSAPAGFFFLWCLFCSGTAILALWGHMRIDFHTRHIRCIFLREGRVFLLLINDLVELHEPFQSPWPSLWNFTKFNEFTRRLTRSVKKNKTIRRHSPKNTQSLTPDRTYEKCLPRFRYSRTYSKVTL